jgi:hypothetical protein
MRAYLKYSTKYVGCSPTPIPGKAGDDRFPLYRDREHGAAWEAVEITQDGDHFYVEFVAAHRSLTITPIGALQTRDAGTRGPWETFFATTQPDGLNLLYRHGEDDSLVPCTLAIEEG